MQRIDMHLVMCFIALAIALGRILAHEKSCLLASAQLNSPWYLKILTVSAWLCWQNRKSQKKREKAMTGTACYLQRRMRTRKATRRDLFLFAPKEGPDIVVPIASTMRKQWKLWEDTDHEENNRVLSQQNQNASFAAYTHMMRLNLNKMALDIKSIALQLQNTGGTKPSKGQGWQWSLHCQKPKDYICLLSNAQQEHICSQQCLVQRTHFRKGPSHKNRAMGSPGASSDVAADVGSIPHTLLSGRGYYFSKVLRGTASRPFQNIDHLPLAALFTSFAPTSVLTRTNTAKCRIPPSVFSLY